MKTLIKIFIISCITIFVVGCIGIRIYPDGSAVKNNTEDSGTILKAIDPTALPTGETWETIRGVIDDNFDNVNGTFDSIEITLTEYGDSITNYSSEISEKLNISDTTAMLSPYALTSELGDSADSTVFATRYFVGVTYAPIENPTFTGIQKVSTTDTLATMAYARTYGGVGTVTIGNVRDEIADSLNVLRPLKVNVSDTTTMLTPYSLTSEVSSGYVPISRTINSHALTSNVTVTASDVGLGNVTNESKATMFTSPTFTGTLPKISTTDTLATQAYARSYGGTGTVTIGDVRDEIADSLNILRPLYVAAVDTADMLTNYALLSEVHQDINDSLDARIGAGLELSDLAVMIADTLSSATIGYYTQRQVDSVATAVGGTTIGDVRDEIADSLNVLRPLYVAVADTADMLSNYLLDSETAASVTGFTPAGGSLTLAGADAITLESFAGTTIRIPTSTNDTIATQAYARTYGGTGTVTIGDVRDEINDSLDVVVRPNYAAKYITYNAQTGTTYTLVLADASKVITMTNASANTLTVPPNSSVAFTTGTQITVVQTGSGTTTIAAGSGVTINSADSALDLRVQYSACTLLKTATDTWLLIGDIE